MQDIAVGGAPSSIREGRLPAEAMSRMEEVLQEARRMGFCLPSGSGKDLERGRSLLTARVS